jgi:hypothetical protein
MKKDSIQPVSKVQAVTAVNSSDSPNLDIEKLAILLQRRYNIIKEIKKLTDDLGDACDRQDDISIDLVLTLRQDQMELCAGNWEQILLLGETDAHSAIVLKHLIMSDPDKEKPLSEAEERIFSIRRKMRDVIRQIKEKDKRIGLRTAREQSYYTHSEERNA